MDMVLQLDWQQMLLRVVLAVIVSLVVGYNRAEHGKAAGMVTTLMVTLAAALAMLQVNQLLPTAGRPATSFVMNDLMRLPLGILTGVGFIGAGAILKRGELIVGVTTAATLWLMTVVGLCIGGGQIVLGLIGTVLALFALGTVKHLEARMKRLFRARFDVEVDGSTDLQDADIRRELEASGLKIVAGIDSFDRSTMRRTFAFEVREHRAPGETTMPARLREFATRPGVLCFKWDGMQ